MKKIVFCVAVLAMMAGCKSDPTYTNGRSAVYGATGIYTDYSKAAISAISGSVLEVRMETNGGDIYMDMINVSMSDNQHFTINEDLAVRNKTGTYTVRGSGSFVNNTVSFSAVAKLKTDTTQTIAVPFVGAY